MNEAADNSPLILVVDDDAAARFMAREALEPHGYRIAEAEDGHLAVQAFAELRPDILLLDVMMPAVDGFLACSRIRELPGGALIPIVLITGLDDLESINRAYEVGATDFITKPVNYPLLPHRVRYMLRAKRTHDELVTSEARLANAQRIAKLGHWEWNLADGRMLWSGQMLKILGVPEVQNWTLGRFLDLVHPEDRNEVTAAIHAAARSRQGFGLNHRILYGHKEPRSVRHEVEFNADEARGGAPRLVGTLQDITERKRAERRAHRLANFDKVTGLPNRVLFGRRLKRVLKAAEEHGRSAALLTVDLDHFKRINDTLGHSSGDQLLREVAERLSRCLRGGERIQEELPPNTLPPIEGIRDPLGHLGGDEFVIGLTAIRSAQHAATIALRIQQALVRPIVLAGHDVFITASIGISAYPEDGRDLETLFRQSGAALNRAKADGRNCYRFYTARMNARASERLSLEAQLHKALEQGQFMLHYQPKVTVSGWAVAGAEALVRWRHPQLGLVSPAKFIPVVEETGLIVPLGEWILREACRQVVAWEGVGLPPLHVSVNLSAIQFNQRNLHRRLAGILRETGVAPELVELEITESLLMNDIELAIGMLKQLKTLGLTISVDDFGIGYSSLSYLKRFPISTLKIDQSFVAGVAHDTDDATIVSAVIALAHSLRLQVVAEGVEQHAQLEFLRARGCDVIQGHYVSRPLPADAFARWVTERQASLRAIS